MSQYYDLHIVYGKDFEKILMRLVEFKYRGICVSFEEFKVSDFKYVRKVGRELGVEVYTRFNVKASSRDQLNKLIHRSVRKFDLICIEKCPLKILKQVSFRNISLIDLATSSPTLLPKVKSVEFKVAFEFNLSKTLAQIVSGKSYVEKTLKNAFILDALKAPIVLTSGARHVREVCKPAELIFSFSALINRRKVNEKYVSTIPLRVLMARGKKIESL